MECCWYIECPKSFVPDSEAELKKSLTATVETTDEDEDEDEDTDADADETAAEDTQKSTGKKKQAPKTSTATTSKKKAPTKGESTVTEVASKKVTTKGKAASTVTSKTSGKSTPVNDTVMTDAHSEPLPLTQSRVKQPSHPTLSQPAPTERSPQALVINASILEQQRHFREVQKFALSCSPSRSCSFRGVPSMRGAADLVIADLPEGLPVPNVSVPSSVVPTWNVKSEDYLQELFEFADEILHDSGALLLFFPFDNGDFLEDIETFFDSFGFAIYKEWMGVNYLPMSSARVPNTTTNRFNMLLLKRVSRPEDSVSWSSTFSIRDVPELVAHGVDVGLNDTLINHCTNPLMDGARPWRGPREKDEYFFSCLVMALTTVGDIVIDVAVGTGMKYSSLLSLQTICLCFF
jgi:hypothetical protein